MVSPFAVLEVMLVAHALCRSNLSSVLLCWHAAAPVPTRMCFTVLAFCSVWFSVRGSLKAPKVDYPLIKVKPVTQPLAVHGM